MEKVNTLMMQILGVRPNEFEKEIIESTGEDLYIKFVLDVVKSTYFRGVSTYEEGSLENALANLAIGIENVKGRDIARKFWINLDSKIKRMWNARAQNFKKVYVVYAEKASVITTLAQLPMNLVNAHSSYLISYRFHPSTYRVDTLKTL